jgi:tape measure domain-containing protein
MPDMELMGLEGIFDLAGFIPGAGTFIDLMGKAGEATDKTGGILNSFSSGISDFFTTLASGAVDTLVETMSSLGAQIIENVANLQQMSVAIDTLVAIETYRTGVVDTMTEAMAASADTAEDLKDRIQDVSLTSPFEYQKILDTFRMSMAFGIASGNAIDLTQALTDMVAGMGLSDQMLERMVYNFGQMNRIGKITRRDIRDLAMAGMDLVGILRDQFNMTMDETNEALATGQLAFEDITKAVINYSKEIYGGAAQRASRTLKGLISSFKDLLFFASKDIGQQAVESLSDSLGRLLDLGIKINNSGFLKLIGVGFRFLGEEASDAIDKVVSSLDRLIFGTNQAADQEEVAVQRITDIVEYFISGAGAKFLDMAFDAFEWGANIVISFAEGFTQAISWSLGGAMDLLSSVLSSFLSGHSPPKVAPYLDVWGESAMNEFLKGFTTADFSILTGLTSSIKSVFDIMIKEGSMSANEASETFRALSSGIAQALDSINLSGTYSSSLIDNLATSMGPLGDELSLLAKLQLDYAASVKVSTDAVDELNAAKKKQEQLDADLILAVQEYNDLARKGADKNVLDQQLTKVNAISDEKFLNEAKIKTLEDEKAVTKENVDLAKEQLAAQKALVQELINLRNLVFTPLPEEKEKEDKKGGGKGLGGYIPPGPRARKPQPGGTPEERIQKQLDRLLARLQTEWNEFYGGLLADFEASGIGAAIDSLKTKWEELSKNIDEFYKKYIEPTLKNWKEDGTLEKIANTLGVISGLLTIVLPLLGLFLQVITFIITPLNTLIISIMGMTAIAIGLGILLGKGFDLLLEKLGIFDSESNTKGENIKLTWEEIKQNVVDNWDAIVVFFEEKKTEFLTAINNMAIDIEIWKNTIASYWTEFGTNLATKWEEFKPTISGVINAIVTKIILFKDDVKDQLEAFQSNTNEIFDAIFGEKGTIKTVWNSFISFLTNLPTTLYTLGENIIGGLVDGFNAKLQDLKDIVNTIVKLLPGEMEDEFIMESPSKLMFGYGKNIVESFQKGLESFAPKIHMPALLPVNPSSSTVNNSYNFGGNNLNNGMDLATLENAIRRVIRTEAR